MVGSAPIPEEQGYTFLGVTLNCINNTRLVHFNMYHFF